MICIKKYSLKISLLVMNSFNRIYFSKSSLSSDYEFINRKEYLKFEKIQLLLSILSDNNVSK